MENQLHSVSDIKKPLEKSSFFVLSYYVPLHSEFRVVVCVTVSVYNDVRFVVISSCLQEDSCLIYVICVSLRRVVSNTYCVFCFVSLHFVSWVPSISSFFFALRFSLTFIYKPLNTITEFFYLQQWSFSTQQNRSWSCFCVCKRGYFILSVICSGLVVFSSYFHQ